MWQSFTVLSFIIITNLLRKFENQQYWSSYSVSFKALLFNGRDIYFNLRANITSRPTVVRSNDEILALLRVKSVKRPCKTKVY